MNTIYAYSTDTYITRGWIKVGETKLTAVERIAQQDGTSNPESLNLLKEWSVPSKITDKKIHAELERMGRRPTRIDKKREWYECSVEDVSTAINRLVYNVARPNSHAPRPEQQECVDMAANYFRRGGKEFLINAKMRFGKTFASYLIAKKLNYKNILVLTYKPSVENGWREDLTNHVYFDGWHYTSGNGFHVDPKAATNVIFASFQDLNDFDKAKWRGITKHHFDLVIVDEMHYGSDTERAKLTMSEMNADRFLFVSGTPLDAVISGRFTEKNTYTWSYADEQAKRRAEKKTGWKTEVYRWLPEMEIHTFEVCDEAKRTVAAYSEDEQFTMTKMFGSEDGETFTDEASVKLWLDQVFGRGVRKNKSPVRTFAADHMLWVMPPNVKSVTAMCKLLTKVVGEEYHIINVAGNNISNLDKVKKMIGHYDKTITVTCGRFNTGVTIPEWDAVYMLGDGKAPETYFQTIYRCQSSDKSRGKEKCYVFDFNPSRVLELVYQYAELTAKKSDTINDGIRKFIEFCPIIDHSGNNLKTVNTEEVVSMISEAGNYIDKFTSSYLFNKDVAEDFDELLALSGGIKNAKAKMTVADNNLDKGKNYDALKKGKGMPRNKDIVEVILEKAKIITKHLPEYVMFVDDVSSVGELLKTDKKDFEEHFGINLKLFKRMVDDQFLNIDRLNRLIAGLK